MSNFEAYDSATTTLVHRISLWMIRWFSPQYRMGRLAYFQDQCLLLGVLACVVFVGSQLEAASWVSDAQWSVVLFVGQFLLNITTIAIFIACIRRQHDLGWSGGWVFFLFVPGLNIIWYLLLMVIPSTKRILGWPTFHREQLHYE